VNINSPLCYIVVCRYPRYAVTTVGLYRGLMVSYIIDTFSWDLEFYVDVMKVILIIYRVSIISFPDYKHLLQENYVEYKHITIYIYNYKNS
jgi:hypothetical protein